MGPLKVLRSEGTYLFFKLFSERVWYMMKENDVKQCCFGFDAITTMVILYSETGISWRETMQS
jgi:hypothetical protein